MERLISFFEIPCSDFKRAVKFYEAVLQVSLSVFECGAEKMALFPEENGKAPGAISYDGKFTPSKDGVLISLNCKDIGDALSRAAQNGGSILKTKTKIECDGLGYFALFSDSEGNTLGLYADK